MGGKIRFCLLKRLCAALNRAADPLNHYDGDQESVERVLRRATKLDPAELRGTNVRRLAIEQCCIAGTGQNLSLNGDGHVVEN